MQRAPQLAVFSREHHVALEIALRLQRARGDDINTTVEATLAFWAQEGRPHFQLEEELLLPAFAAHVGADDPDIRRILAEHTELRRGMDGLRGDPDAGALRVLGERLRDHVRYEERVVFGRIEATLSEPELAALGAALICAGSAHRPPRA